MVVATAERLWPAFLQPGRAACAGEDPELFVKSNDRRGPRLRRVRKAKEVCAGCPLRAACEEWATATRQTGVWGGTTDEERRRRAREARS